ncbi:Ribonucleases P/MRP protein subunit pop1 [Acrodontium crateriforme]|uniref:Ribonucleases P/MRP protein subunit pop1 n=1 Tax=Acrodontium crateriforme TaxID=150365 RepID=A0AAQ3M0H6_9PEZI|nr:Ribonucleases P/MRP protein subunit pop1 [Acrodontium crateriforme]
MEPKKPPAKAPPKTNKRKEPPNPGSKGNDKRPRLDHRTKQREARHIVTQTTIKAFKHGELDVDKFVKAREFEIRALEEGLNRSKKALNRRAFQQVPKDLRRRTASHNVKKVPKRLRKRAEKEMLEDNTPTVTSRRRKPTRHMRLRLETVKKLRALGSKRKAEKKATITDDPTETGERETATKDSLETSKKMVPFLGIRTRAAKVKKARLAQPPIPKVKFRKRQLHKSWLPTHMFHAKRAHMTPPSAPLWRFSIPMSPTIKSYRPTHRANTTRGAIAWDMSYISTIGLEGQEDSLISVLKGLRFGKANDVYLDSVYGPKGTKWRSGLRALESFVYERKGSCSLIAPVTVIWCALPGTDNSTALQKSKRKLLLRVHPSAFFMLWEEINRLAKVAKPQASVEDLRFEMGSIEVSGPGSTEALLGAMWPSGEANDSQAVPSSVERAWKALAGVHNPALLPAGALIGFDIQDPRLHHPPRTIKTPQTDAEHNKLLELVASWPVDSTQTFPAIFDRKARLAACAALPSQKSINRRKNLAKPGEYPEPSTKDPKIPVLLYVSSRPPLSGTCHHDRNRHQASWTVLLPWKCVSAAWYSIIYYPLSTGQQPRFGGLEQQRQLAFETGRPWFPADYPGTQAGWDWEITERKRRHDEWKRKPKAKRIAWDSVKLDNNRKGEVGPGWSCDWERLVMKSDEDVEMTDGLSIPETGKNHDTTAKADTTEKSLLTKKPPTLTHVPTFQAHPLLSSSIILPTSLTNGVITIRLSVFRGVPTACARIYRLPSDPAKKKEWLSLIPPNQPGSKNLKPRTRASKATLPRLPKDAPPHLLQQRLAASLLEPPRIGDDSYPACPGEEDLMGYVTTGNFNLGEGQGTGIGCLMLERARAAILNASTSYEGKLCVVRNAGNGIGRLARWDLN